MRGVMANPTISSEPASSFSKTPGPYIALDFNEFQQLIFFGTKLFSVWKVQFIYRTLLRITYIPITHITSLYFVSAEFLEFLFHQCHSKVKHFPFSTVTFSYYDCCFSRGDYNIIVICSITPTGAILIFPSFVFPPFANRVYNVGWHEGAAAALVVFWVSVFPPLLFYTLLMFLWYHSPKIQIFFIKTFYPIFTIFTFSLSLHFFVSRISPLSPLFLPHFLNGLTRWDGYGCCPRVPGRAPAGVRGERLRRWGPGRSAGKKSTITSEVARATNRAATAKSKRNHTPRESKVSVRNLFEKIMFIPSENAKKGSGSRYCLADFGAFSCSCWYCPVVSLLLFGRFC